MHELWSEIDRRLLVKLGTAGLAALALPGAARAAMAQGFTHGVASGEPGAVVSPQNLATVYGVRGRVERCSQGLPHVVVDGLTT